MSLFNKSSNIKYGITSINTKEFIYVWSIKNFKFYYFEPEKSLYSPKFTTGENEEHNWDICVQENQEHFSLNLRLYAGGPEVDAGLILSICDQQGIEKVSKESSFLVKYKNNEARNFPEFIRKNYLFDEKNRLLVDNTLTIKCKLYFRGDIVSDPQVEQNDFCMKNVVSHDWECLLKDVKLSDVKIIVGQKEFQAHKCILAARSRIFSAMFEHDMLEKNESVVNIEDIDAKVMEEVLRFIYCGKIESKISVYNLYAAANKYELEELQQICEDKLLHSLNIENVGESLIFADVYKAEKLKKHVIEFISIHAKDINFEKFKIDVEPHSPLLVDLIRHLISK